MEERVKQFMQTFGISEEEAKQMIADDDAIEHGEDLFPLTAEQQQASKEMRSTGTRKTTTYNFKKRERKPDDDKRTLISYLDSTLRYNSKVEDFTITNPERQIDFNFNGRNFRIVLSAPRPPKG